MPVSPEALHGQEKEILLTDVSFVEAENDPTDDYRYQRTQASGTVQELLDVDLANVAPSELYGAGNWVLALRAYSEQGGVLAAGNTAYVCPYVARVRIGAGRSAFDVDLDLNSVLQIPAQKVFVQIVEDQWIPCARPSAAESYNYAVYAHTHVRASILRGASRGRATRTMYLPPTQSTNTGYPASAAYHGREVPIGAVSARLLGDWRNDSRPWAQNPVISFVDDGGYAYGRYPLLDGSDYGAVAVPVPRGRCSRWRLDYDAPPDPALTPGGGIRAIEFEIEL